MVGIVFVVGVSLVCWGFLGWINSGFDLMKDWDNYNCKQKLYATFICGPIAWIYCSIVMFTEITRLSKFISWLADSVSNFNKKMMERLK